MADLTPDSHILEALVNQNILWWQALAELVDNSFDAGAMRVSIVSDGRSIKVIDDGDGVEDILAVFRLGHHQKRKKSRDGLGRYGIGAKDCWLFAGDAMSVSTVRKGSNQLTELTVDIKDLQKNKWQCNDPVVSDTELPSGTTIAIPLRKGKQRPSKAAFDELSWVFTPAMNSGKQLIHVENGKKSLLKPVAFPPREDVVIESFEIDGKSVSIDIGIVKDGHAFTHGPFWLIYGHRVLQSTSIGTLGYSASRLGGTITIGKEWKLAKNKNAITESVDQLSEEIQSRIEVLLKKASERDSNDSVEKLRREIDCELSDMLRPFCVTKRSRPGKNGKKGTVEKKGTDRTTSPPKSISNFDLVAMNPLSVGVFDALSSRVSLNLENACVATAVVTGNKTVLLCIAASLIAEFSCRQDVRGQSMFRFGDEFPIALGQALKGTSQKNGVGKDV
jgi:hypothetical protein